MVISLVQSNRDSNSEGQVLGQLPVKVSVAETEGILVHIGLKIFLGQAMIGSQNKYLGAAAFEKIPEERYRN